MNCKKITFTIFALLNILIILFLMGSMKAEAAAGTIYESEPNDDFDYADVTYDDYDNYGNITANDTQGDMWVVEFPYSGYANFWVGNIPAGCNYDLAVYDLVDGVVLGVSQKTGNKQELLTLPVVAGREYYIYVLPATQVYSSSNYKMRAKLYPEANLNIPLHEQLIDNTCSAASARMVLYNYGWNLSEEGIVDKMVDLGNDNGVAWNLARNVARTINYYLELSRKPTRYNAVWIGNLSETAYTERLIDNICNGYPVIPLITVYESNIANDTEHFHRTTPGHYIVAKGIYYDFDSGIFRSIINDPFYQHSIIYNEMPVSMVWTCNMNHPYDFIICVN